MAAEGPGHPSDVAYDDHESGSWEGSTSLYDPLDVMLKNYMEISCGIAWTMLALCGLGIVSNTTSIIIYTHPSMRRAPINVLLTGLSVIDLCLSILSIPAFVIPGLYASYQGPFLNMLMCYSSVYVYPLTSMTHTASVWTFVVIAVERWQAVCGAGLANGRHQTLLRHQRWRSSAYALTVVCLISFAYNFVRFFEFRLVYSPEDDFRTTEDPTGNDTFTTMSSFPTMGLIVAPLLKNSTAYPAYMSVYYVGLFLISHFAAPFIALLIVNGLTLRAVYIARQRRRRILTKRERKEHRTTWMMISIVATFIFCYTLLFSLNIIEAVDADWFYKEDNKMTSYALNDISNMLVVVNSATTAFIYFIFNRNYRELCMALVAKWFGCLWCCCRRTRDHFNERCDRIENRRRSTHPTVQDTYEMSDATAYAVTAVETETDGTGPRSSLFYGLMRLDVSPQTSATTTAFHHNNNNNVNLEFAKSDL